MDFAQQFRNISQRYSISSLITFGVLLVLTIVNLHQDSRIGKMEEKSKTNRFISKKSLDDKPDDTPSSLLDLLCCPETVNIVLPSKTKSCDDKPDDTPKPGLGSLYTRWGRTTCPTNSSLVYDGVAGGQFYDHSGGGSNLLCLPNDPIWANYTTEVEEGGYIYGSEYELGHHSKILFSFANAKSLQQHNVPCAVCLTRQPAVVMMLPARTKCYAGWTAEYSGYLMAERHTHKGRHDYVCVDYAPEADPAGYKNEDGALLYFVQAVCGSLPCPPYVNGQELTCVVCSKY